MTYTSETRNSIAPPTPTASTLSRPSPSYMLKASRSSPCLVSGAEERHQQDGMEQPAMPDLYRQQQEHYAQQSLFYAQGKSAPPQQPQVTSNGFKLLARTSSRRAAAPSSETTGNMNISTPLPLVPSSQSLGSEYGSGGYDHGDAHSNSRNGSYSIYGGGGHAYAQSMSNVSIMSSSSAVTTNSARTSRTQVEKTKAASSTVGRWNSMKMILGLRVGQDLYHSDTMLKATALLLCAVVACSAVAPNGIDVSEDQNNINWAAVRANGVEFAYIKATEGTTSRSPAFNRQYNGAANASLLRGAYHVARPDRSSGAEQAKFFLEQGFGWTPNGKTLPGALVLEASSPAAPCYGLSQHAMVKWIEAFSNAYHARTSRYPVIYTSTKWWVACTGNSAFFGQTSPLWITRYGTTVGSLPAGWRFHSFWQYESNGPNPGEQDMFNGNSAGLKRMALGR
ncbi:hypothetical protein BGZ70_008045 [Mortierella alpina]|uniref:N,O-diacetylmuramidase n=1 Tax=Mortierella alpina TaxID=64518 RepID=A0A9P6JFW1_MORAP|nr:hypothetical protein BGZ70_008045 [Mortierella alpina]